jgi:hypothetical protein
MPLVPFDTLPEDARVWVFGASTSLDERAEHLLAHDVDAYLVQWRAHGAPLTVARAFTEGRFLTVAVDQRTAGASGCSIDGLYRALQDAERATGASLVSGGRVFYRDASGAVHGATQDEFAELAAAGIIKPDTIVFDTTVQTLGDWRARFEKKAAESWHARLMH